jgi:hypothetical protein
MPKGADGQAHDARLGEKNKLKNDMVIRINQYTPDKNKIQVNQIFIKKYLI